MLFLQDDGPAASLQLDQDQGVVEVLPVWAVACVVSAVHLHHQNLDLVSLKSWAELQACEKCSGEVRWGLVGRLFLSTRGFSQSWQLNYRLFSKTQVGFGKLPHRTEEHSLGFPHHLAPSGPELVRFKAGAQKGLRLKGGVTLRQKPPQNQSHLPRSMSSSMLSWLLLAIVQQRVPHRTTRNSVLIWKKEHVQRNILTYSRLKCWQSVRQKLESSNWGYWGA